MGAGRTASATSGQDGPAASLALASHHRRRSLRSARGLRLASPARWAFPALADRLLVVSPPAGERYLGSAERRAGHGRPRTGRPRTAANGVRARQPNRQSRRHRGGRSARRSLSLGRQSRTRGTRPSEPSGANARRWSTRMDVCSLRRSRPPTGTTRNSGQGCCASRGGSGPFSPGAGRMRALLGRALPMPRTCGSRWWALDHAHKALRSRNGDG